ncbi:pyridoxamine 5'-phosphate oxidase family protein [Candidatus Saccharibacteria bacterium]|nr:pyridoxamine 5'-phosphate oxidase family protein [Candidatus Saccharibacteria bacterium]
MSKSDDKAEHVKRIRKELINAGMTNYGLLKFETKHLPSLVHDNEHIGGVVYGLNDNGSAMIVATDLRVIYLDHKFLYHKNDELSYDIIGGVSINQQGGHSAVILHTRAGDFKLRYVNTKAAKRFVKFIEKRQIEKDISEKSEPDVKLPAFAMENGQNPVQLSQRARIFLVSHDIGVLSSIDGNGIPHGAVVYYASDSNNYLYVVTKQKTHKASNIQSNAKVAFTVFDTSSMQTIQLSGIAHIEQDQKIKEKIFHDILRPRFDGQHAEMPPIMYLPAGEYVVVCIKPTIYKFSDYKSQQ